MLYKLPRFSCGKINQVNIEICIIKENRSKFNYQIYFCVQLSFFINIIFHLSLDRCFRSLFKPEVHQDIESGSKDGSKLWEVMLFYVLQIFNSLRSYFFNNLIKQFAKNRSLRSYRVASRLPDFTPRDFFHRKLIAVLVQREVRKLKSLQRLLIQFS